MSRVIKFVSIVILVFRWSDDGQWMRWEDDGVCYQLGSQGPCAADQTFAPDSVTGDAVCRDTTEEEEEEDEEVTTQISRVFDVIPSGGNSINHNTNNMIKVTQQTCVLDARGKCRRKIKFKRNGDNSDARAQEFKIWLQSFQKRAPNNFNCSS